jgi:hypothetical protein
VKNVVEVTVNDKLNCWRNMQPFTENSNNIIIISRMEHLLTSGRVHVVSLSYDNAVQHPRTTNSSKPEPFPNWSDDSSYHRCMK